VVATESSTCMLGPTKKPFCDDGHSEIATSWQYGGK
jgi:CDGSH-type Zn-finger protein